MDTSGMISTRSSVVPKSSTTLNGARSKSLDLKHIHGRKFTNRPSTSTCMSQTDSESPIASKEAGNQAQALEGHNDSRYESLFVHLLQSSGYVRKDEVEAMVDKCIERMLSRKKIETNVRGTHDKIKPLVQKSKSSIVTVLNYKKGLTQSKKFPEKLSDGLPQKGKTKGPLVPAKVAKKDKGKIAARLEEPCKTKCNQNITSNHRKAGDTQTKTKIQETHKKKDILNEVNSEGFFVVELDTKAELPKIPSEVWKVKFIARPCPEKLLHAKPHLA